MSIWYFFYDHLNIFGYSPVFLIFKKKRCKSKIGFLVSLIIIFIIIYSSKYFFDDVVYKKNPKIEELEVDNANKKKNKNDVLIDKFAYKNRPFVISAVNPNNEPIENLFNILDISINYVNLCENKVIDSIIMEKCTENHLKHFKNMDLFTNEIYYDTRYLLCLPFNYSYLITEENKCKFFNIKIDQCKNKKSCVSDKEYLKYRNESIFLMLEISNDNMDFSQYKDYKNIEKYSLQIELFSKDKYYYVVYLKKYCLTSDIGLVFKEEVHEDMLSYEKIINRNYISNTTELGIIYFVISKKHKDINRSYKKILDVLGQIGGITNILFFIGQMIITPFEELNYFLEIINEIFNSDTDKNKKKEIFSNLNYSLNSPLENVNIDKNQIDINRNIEINSISSIFFYKIFLEPLDLVELVYIDKKKQMDEEILFDDEFVKTTNYKAEKKKSKKENRVKFDKKEEKKIIFHLNPLEYLKILLRRKKSKNLKIHNIFQAINFIKKTIDINCLIRNSIQIDKLKQILFSQDQIEIFETIPKPELFETRNNIENRIMTNDINEKLYFYKEYGLNII